MKNVLAEVSIFCLWTNWIHLVTCRKIEFRELHCCSRCALDKIFEIDTFDPCSQRWSGQKWFLACGEAKKENWRTTKLFWNMCPKPFSWAKKKRKLFSDGKSRGPLLARVALNNTKTYNISDVDMNFHSVNPQLCGQNQCSGITYQMTASNEVWLHEHCLKDMSTHLWIIRTNILQISLIILLIM